MNRKIIISICLLLAVALTSCGPKDRVRISESEIILPTYQMGGQEKYPVFFNGRAYQGAEGYVYPYPLIDKLTDNVVDQKYKLVSLDNEYVHVSVMPEMGGRIFTTHSKSDEGYPFFYNQTGIKPALVGMQGAWLSGGIEWNIPDHHRPSTYMMINYDTAENEDGSSTVWVGEMELRHRLKWSVGVTVYPERSWVEARVLVMNPTDMIQSMLYWANVSVHCDENYRVIFPPDVRYGTAHHKNHFNHWPLDEATIGDGEVCRLDEWASYTGNSRSIFAHGSEMEFLAGYDEKKDAGTVHVANRHVVPGKKFFLWGNNHCGTMWNKTLSDRDGHYLELMVGAYSDNQPDYSWVEPGEIREFTQTWYPIKGIKGVKNATVEAAVNFVPAENGNYFAGFCPTMKFTNAKVVVTNKGKTVYEETVNIDPANVYAKDVKVGAFSKENELNIALYDSRGNLLVDYTPVVFDDEPVLPGVIEGHQDPKTYKTVEELYLAGLRADLFNNARLDHMDYYSEALRRDPDDARVNIEVGKHYIRTGEFEKAEEHLILAQERLSHDYTRVKDSEALLYLGTAYKYLGKLHEAENAWWAATWNYAYKHRAFYELAALEIRKGNLNKALELIDESLLLGGHDLQALSLKAYIQRKLGQNPDKTIVLAQSVDPLDYWSAIEKTLALGTTAEFIAERKPNRSEDIIAVQELLEVVNNYLSVEDYQDVATVLDAAVSAGAPYKDYPLVHYYKAYCQAMQGDNAGAKETMDKAGRLSAVNNFPMRIEEVNMFKKLIDVYPENSYVYYYQGCLLRYLGQKEAARDSWEKSYGLNPDFDMTVRNLAFSYGRDFHDYQKSKEFYDKAVKLNPGDAFLLNESDMMYEKAHVSAKERLKRLEARRKTVEQHDDAVMTLIYLYNENGEYDKALKYLENRHFHIWEGSGSGKKIYDIYSDSHFLKGMELMNKKKYDEAAKHFEATMEYPDNLESYLHFEGGNECKANYMLAEAYGKKGDTSKAGEYYKKSAGSKTPTVEMMYYKVLAMRKINNKQGEADALKALKKKADVMMLCKAYAYDIFNEVNMDYMKSDAYYAEALYGLLQGNNAQAGKDLAQSLNYNPSNIWAKYRKDSLK